MDSLWIPQWISHQPRDPFTASKAKTKSSLQRPAVAAPRTEVPSLSQRVASAPCFSKTWATWVTINGRNHGIYGIYMGYIYIYIWDHFNHFHSFPLIASFQGIQCRKIRLQGTPSLLCRAANHRAVRPSSSASSSLAPASSLGVFEDSGRFQGSCSPTGINSHENYHLGSYQRIFTNH